jgi:hypothetical protein
MSAIRRLYFYGLALVSLEVVVWGVVGLLRTAAAEGLGAASGLLATGLSLVLVGLPIFLLHWRTIQREAQADPDERASRVRAVFLNGVLAITLGPVCYALLALLNRALAGLLGLPAFSAWFGADQNALDNWLAIVVNGLAGGYFAFVLRSDWRATAAAAAEAKTGPAPEIPAAGEQNLAEARRLFRYFWVLAGLTMLVAGVYNLLRYLLYTPGQNPSQTLPYLAGGLALLLVGGPLWGYHWRLVQESLYDADERSSLLRLVVLYAVLLAAVVGVLSTVGAVVTSLIGWLLGEPRTPAAFVQGNSAELGAAVPLAAMWVYYGRTLQKEVAGLPDRPRRAALRRLYFYILAILGLAVLLAGLYSLVEQLARLAFEPAAGLASARAPLSGALSALLAGLPLWLAAWRPMQVEAARPDDSGDHARRSVLRKAYLYLVLFLLVDGLMVFGGRILYTLLDSLLSGQAPADFGQALARLFGWLVIDLAFLAYHLRALRRDGRLAQQSLGGVHARFPTLVLVEEDSPFGQYLSADLARLAPRLPVALHPVEQGAPDEALLGAAALVIPVGLALDPPESLRLWMSEYLGRRLLVPLPGAGYTWPGQVDKSPQQLARDAAQALRQMAEGEAPRLALPAGPWAVAGYILGGLFALQLLAALFTLMISTLFR